MQAPRQGAPHDAPTATRPGPRSGLKGSVLSGGAALAGTHSTPPSALRQTPPLKGETLLCCPLKAPLLGELAAQRPEGFGAFGWHNVPRDIPHPSVCLAADTSPKRGGFTLLLLKGALCRDAQKQPDGDCAYYTRTLRGFCGEIAKCAERWTSCAKSM